MYSLPNLEPVLCPCLGLTAASWPAYRFLGREVRWSGILISLRIFHSLLLSTVKGFSIVSEAEIEVFMEFSLFFYEPKDVANLISGSSTFSKSSLYIWKFSVHILLKPSLKDFEHYSSSTWSKCNYSMCLSILWNCPSLGLKWKLTFSSLVITAEFSLFVTVFGTAL